MDLTGTTVESPQHELATAPGRPADAADRERAGRADSEERWRLELARLRTDLGWLCCDRAHGGPARDEEIAALRLKIRELEMQRMK